MSMDSQMFDAGRDMVRDAAARAIAEELEVLRDLRRRVDEMAEAATMLFKVHRGAPVYPAVRVEVPIEAWDNLMDAIGDVERHELDKQ